MFTIDYLFFSYVNKKMQTESTKEQEKLPHELSIFFNKSSMEHQPLLSIDVKNDNNWIRKYSTISIFNTNKIYDFIDIYKDLPDIHKRIHTHFYEGHPMKALIDFDYNICPQKEHLTKELIEKYMKIICNFVRSKYGEHIDHIIYDNSRNNKISYHILFHGFYFLTIQQGKDFTSYICDQLMRYSKIGIEISTYIDKQIYRNGGSIRFYQSHKYHLLESKKRIANISNESINDWIYHFPSEYI